jgi:hypothetical protein
MRGVAKWRIALRWTQMKCMDLAEARVPKPGDRYKLFLFFFTVFFFAFCSFISHVTG